MFYGTPVNGREVESSANRVSGFEEFFAGTGRVARLPAS